VTWVSRERTEFKFQLATLNINPHSSVGVQGRSLAGKALQTTPRLLLDDCDAWTLNASLTRLSSYRKCSKRRILGRSAQATSRLRIEGMTKCSPTALGFDFGSGMGFAADLNLKASFGFRASDAFPGL